MITTNETTEKLLRELADKLGTTAEHLWGVLVRQAPITAITDLVACSILITACVIGGKYLLKWHKHLQDKNETDHPGLVLSCLSYACLLVVTLFCLQCSFSVIVTALFNPEYWALKQIIHK